MTANQTQVLMKRFDVKPKLAKGEKYELAKLLNVSDERIRVWYRNMRFKKKGQILLAEGEEYSAIN